VDECDILDGVRDFYRHCSLRVRLVSVGRSSFQLQVGV
jgi:hypothetical protein